MTENQPLKIDVQYHDRILSMTEVACGYDDLDIIKKVLLEQCDKMMNDYGYTLYLIDKVTNELQCYGYDVDPSLFSGNKLTNPNNDKYEIIKIKERFTVVILRPK